MYFNYYIFIYTFLFHSFFKILYYFYNNANNNINNKPPLPMLSSLSYISLCILSIVNLHIVLIIQISEVFVSEILFSEALPLPLGCPLAWCVYLHILWLLKHFGSCQFSFNLYLGYNLSPELKYVSRDQFCLSLPRISERDQFNSSHFNFNSLVGV